MSEQSAELTDSQMDAVLGGQSLDEATTQTEPAQAAAAPTPEATPAPVPEISFDYNGKPIKVPATDPRAVQWARQGYDYNQKMADYNRRNAEVDARFKQAQSIAEKYKQYEDFVATPEGQKWWEHVQGSWDSRQQAASPNDPTNRELQALRQQMTDLQQFKQQLSEERTQQQQQQEDEKLQAEFNELTKQYPSIDFGTPDAEGKSMEYRVLEHAAKIGTSSIRAAFRDLRHDDLVKLEADRAKESLAQDLQKQRSLGILGKTQTPKTGVQVAKNIKNQSYDDLLREGAAELGIQMG